MTKNYEYLKCELTDEEISALARDLATSNRKRTSIEQQKKEIDSDLKSQIEAENTKIGRLSDQIGMGYEYRNIECRIELDTPTDGMKRYVRMDTGEEVKVIRMTDADRQAFLDLQAAADAQDQKPEPIVTPIPYVPRIDGPSVEVLPAGEAAVASVTSMGGSHQRGTRQNQRRRNPEAEAFADGSGVAEVDGDDA